MKIIGPDEIRFQLKSFAGPRGEPGQGVPEGGRPGQVLRKAGTEDYNAAWAENDAAKLGGKGPDEYASAEFASRLRDDFDEDRVVRVTDTRPDHDGLPESGKTLTIRGGAFEGCSNFVTGAKNLYPYPYAFAKESPRFGVSFANTGRVIRVSGTAEKAQNFAISARTALPAELSPGDRVILRTFVTAVCPSSFSVRVNFYNAAGTLLGKMVGYGKAYDNSASLTIPADAATMDAMIFLPGAGESIEAAILPVLLRADDEVVQYPAMAEGTLLRIDETFDGASHISAFPCDVRAAYMVGTQAYIEENRDYITPEAFGAEGNGNTDDTQAFCDALAYAQNRGIALRAARTYRVSDTLRIQTDGADVCIHELQYSGTGAAISVEASNISLAAHCVRSGGVGIELRSDSRAILRCVLRLGCVYASGHALNLAVTNYPISINHIFFATLDAGTVGSCVHYDTSGMAEGVYCGEINYYGGNVQRGQWGFDGLSGTAKIINVDIENNVYGGINTSGSLYCFGLRTVEDMRDLPGPLLRIAGCIPKGTIFSDQQMDIGKIDLSDAIDYYTTADSAEPKTLYSINQGLTLEMGVANTIWTNDSGAADYRSGAMLGRKAVIVGKKILIQRLYETKRVITEDELDMHDNYFSYDVARMIPTIYEAGAAMSTVRLHPSFASFAHDTVTVIQTDEHRITLYDCEGHLVFDGSTHGAGTYRLRAYHDYDDNAGISYAEHLPLIDYSREKWMISAM